MCFEFGFYFVIALSCRMIQPWTCRNKLGTVVVLQCCNSPNATLACFRKEMLNESNTPGLQKCLSYFPDSCSSLLAEPFSFCYSLGVSGQLSKDAVDVQEAVDFFSTLNDKSLGIQSTYNVASISFHSGWRIILLLQVRPKCAAHGIFCRQKHTHLFPAVMHVWLCLTSGPDRTAGS